jgi:hypothetical protein
MTKRDALIATMSEGWVAIEELGKSVDWQRHTVRGAISSIAKTHKVERRREDGVTSYRIAKDENN